MRQAARALLGPGVRDPVTAPSEAALARLPEPAYVATLRRTLTASGIEFLDLGYDVTRSTTPRGRVFGRIYRVLSFVWDDALWVTRPGFAERHFAEWPDPLQAIWRDVCVDMPDERPDTL